ncbi:protein unc-13 homolog D-like [Dreissena polymorpha]|uniref:protein unc-13 homolog D-like n=1 Tax=Dreissena polymorpha TaxID=45954 RepID=UPI002264017E|nr:protein unc-13 homolog D-like [Dreissena polymorpha]
MDNTGHVLGAFFSDDKNENIYRGLLRCLLHPLGTPDNSTQGLKHGDLIDYVREVFEVDRVDHELYIFEELPIVPKHTQLNLTVLEANGLRGMDFSEDTCNTYCLVTLHHQVKGKNSWHLIPKSPNSSSKSTPSTSPSGLPRQNSLTEGARFSPISGRKGVDSLDCETARTLTVKHSSHPKWNEEFALDIEDMLSDELHLYVCDEDFSADVKPEKHKHHNLKHFLSVLRHNSESERDIGVTDSCLGKINIPIRDISTLGTDEWYDIVSLVPYKGKPRCIGKCHLQLGISYKQQELDERYQYSNDDFYRAYRQFLQHTYKICRKNPSRHVGDQYGCLTLKDYRVLKIFAVAYNIPKLSQVIVSLICQLEIQSEENLSNEQGDRNLSLALDELRMTWAIMQIGQKNILDRMPLTDSEISRYRKVASRYIEVQCITVDELPDLFPPSVEKMDVLKTKLGIVVQLLGLNLWEPSCDPKAELSDKLLRKLQSEISSWIDTQLEHVKEQKQDDKDEAVVEIEKIIDLVDTTCTHCTVLAAFQQFYNNIGINYYRTISFAMEKRISAVSCEVIEKMNKYKKKYNNFPANIMMASKLSLRLYNSLRRLFSELIQNVGRRDSFRMLISHYQEWFEESMIYWLQTFRSECIQRMEKALEIDKDLVVVTSLVKYSHSSVDVQTCFAQVIGEWRKIDLKDADCALMGVIKVTDIICDGARLYAHKVQSILERNCYFDNNHKAEFDVNDRLCITVNNIEHVRLYLSKLPELLAWDDIVLNISARHHSEIVGKQAHDTLQRLTDMANNEILSNCASLLKQICGKMQIEIERYMELFTRKSSEKTSSVDELLGYITNNLQTLETQLMPNIYPFMIEQLWNVTLTSLDNQIKQGNSPEFYNLMKQHLRSITAFFLQSGLDDRVLQSVICEEFKDKLDMNSKLTNDLMLDYFSQLSSNIETPTEYFGNLAYKAAYVEETRGHIMILVNVLRGSELPGLDPSGLSDPYVEVSLQPQKLFRFSHMQRTHVVKQTLNPVFNVLFQFPNISKEYLSLEGTCILLSVFDHDNIGRDDFAGEVVIKMSTIRQIGIDRSMDRVHASIMPLHRPKKPLQGPFVVLCMRDWDKDARKFVSDRHRFIHRQPMRTDKPDGFGLFASFLSSFTNRK